jgi:cytochrome P450
MLTSFSHETTSSAFTWATYLLAIHPNVQTRLRAEVRGALPSDPDSEIELTAILETLPLLNAVCNETLRLYPTVPLTMRNARIDTTIDNVFIPQGTQIILVPWATNRLPQLWGPDADKFFPERWIDMETGKHNNTGGSTSNYDTLTFLHGPRSCIGKEFAKAELRCLIAAFVAAFEMELADPNYVAIPYGTITTKPWGGMPLRLKVVQ